jgi:hypothetical protein
MEIRSCTQRSHKRRPLVAFVGKETGTGYFSDSFAGLELFEKRTDYAAFENILRNHSRRVAGQFVPVDPVFPMS